MNAHSNIRENGRTTKTRERIAEPNRSVVGLLSIGALGTYVMASIIGLFPSMLPTLIRTGPGVNQIQAHLSSFNIVMVVSVTVRHAA
jgi:hypothetical protein